MTFKLGEVGKPAAKLAALATTMLLVGGLASAAPASGDTNQCAPAGVEHATVLPKKLFGAGSTGLPANDHKTATVEPLSSVDVAGLGLRRPGTLTVATLSDAPPPTCINPPGLHRFRQ